MSEEKNYDKIGNLLAILCVIMTILLGIGFITGSSWYFWMMAIINLTCAPICFIFYLIEVKKGIFADRAE